MIATESARNTKVSGVWRYGRHVGAPGTASSTCADDRFAQLSAGTTLLQVTGCSGCFLPHGIATSWAGDFVVPFRSTRYDRI